MQITESAIKLQNNNPSWDRLVQQDIRVPEDMERHGVAGLFILLMISVPLTGCFADSGNMPEEGDLEVDIAILEGGFQNLKISASSSMSVFIPYLIVDESTGFVQNSTIIDLEKGESRTISVLAPPELKK